VPPLTAIPTEMGKESRRERPRSGAHSLSPRPVKGRSRLDSRCLFSRDGWRGARKKEACNQRLMTHVHMPVLSVRNDVYRWPSGSLPGVRAAARLTVPQARGNIYCSRTPRKLCTKRLRWRLAAIHEVLLRHSLRRAQTADLVGVIRDETGDPLRAASVALKTGVSAQF